MARWILGNLRKERWSPYASGAALGLLFVATLALTGKFLGGSTAYANLYGYLAGKLSPALVDSYFFKFVTRPEISWQVIQVAGIALGAFLAAVLSGTFRLRAVQTGWSEVFGPSPTFRWLLVFVACIFIEYGAALAGGCTSGLAIAGGTVFSPAAFLFVGGVFATGIPVAFLLHKVR